MSCIWLVQVRRTICLARRSKPVLFHECILGKLQADSKKPESKSTMLDGSHNISDYIPQDDVQYVEVIVLCKFRDFRKEGS